LGGRDHAADVNRGRSCSELSAAHAAPSAHAWRCSPSRRPAPRALSWSAPLPIQPSYSLNSVSCPSSTLCVAGDQDGDIFTSTDPDGGVASDWTEIKQADTVGALLSISCASNTLCVAGDSASGLLVSTDPAGTEASDWVRVGLGGAPWQAISCTLVTSGQLCVATGYYGEVAVSTDPGGGSASDWTITYNVGADKGMSCTTAGVCIGLGGNYADPLVFSSSTPTGDSKSDWTSTKLPGLGLEGVSCTPTLCVIVDGNGNTLTSSDPTGTANPTGPRRPSTPARR